MERTERENVYHAVEISVHKLVSEDVSVSAEVPAVSITVSDGVITVV